MSEGKPPNPPQHGLPPVSQPFPGSLTPGWNDPPSIQYNPTTSGGTPGRTKLNKRVPFPLQQSNTTTKPTAVVQPCQAPMAIGQQTMGIPSNSGNIAVVHPLQHTTNVETATIAPHQPTPTLPPVAGLTESSMPPPPTPATTASSSPSQMQTHTEFTIPTMFVPAVPRQPDANAAQQSTVQHL